MASPTSFRETVRTLGFKGLILVLQAFFDDAGTHDSAEVVVWGGFVGTDEQWFDLDEKWRAKLAIPFAKPELWKPPLSRFHLSPCAALDGEFKGYTRAESDSIQHDFRQIICDSGVVGISYSIDRPAYERLVTGDAQEFLGDAEQACFGACFNGAFAQSAKHFPAEDRLMIVFDWVTDAARQAKLRAVADRVEQAPGSRPHIVGAYFGKVINNTPLQAADIIATENYWDAQAFLRDHNRIPRPHFKHFLGNVQAEGQIMREQEIKHYMWKYGFLDGPEPQYGD
jgi:hypothetical protein